MADDRTEGLEAILSRARAAWPTVDVADATFCAWLEDRSEPEASGRGRLHTDDLYLACACASGASEAIAAFDEHFMPGIEAALAGVKLDRAATEEVKQRLRDKLLVGRDGHGKIATYRGRGPLRSWLRAAAVREALTMARQSSKDVPMTGALLDAAVAGPEDPELAYVRDQYRLEFKRAFEQAMGTLSDRQLTILRYKFVDQATVDEIAAVYNVHRATPSRWLGEIRAHLRAETCARLSNELGLDKEAVDGLLRLVASQLDASISAYLQPSPSR